MKKIIVMVAFCLLSLSSQPASSLENVLSLEDALALYEGDESYVGRIKKLLAQDINATDSYFDNRTSLMHASLHGYPEIVKSLIAAGADIEAKNDSGKTALMFAVSNENTEIVNVLIEAEADIHAKDDNGVTALYFAAVHSKPEAVSILIEAGARNADGAGSFGWTALISAAVGGQTEIVKSLIEIGVDINVQDDDGDTALLYAIQEGHTEMSIALIEAGTNLEIKSSNVFYKGDTALICAAKDGHIEILQALIVADANLETQNDDSYTALTMATRYGETEAVNILVKAGANLEAKTNYGTTALIYAAYNNYPKILKNLIAVGANIDAQNNGGDTALIYAAGDGNTEMVTALLDAGAAIDVKNNKSYTALMSASSKGHKGIVSILTEAAQGFYAIRGTDHNYYEAPYAGETSILTKQIGNEKNKIIKRYNFPTAVNNFLDDGNSITGKLESVYREDIAKENGDTALILYRLMYTLSNHDSNGMTELSFIEGEKTERQAYGQAIYILNSGQTKVQLFSRDIYFGNQDLSSSNTLSGVIGNNTHFKAIDNSIISVQYTLQSSSNQTAGSHTAIVYRNKIEDIHDKTVFCQVEASFPLIDKNNPYRYTIQNALDSTPATSYVEDTEYDLMTIQFDFSSDHTFTDIALINGYAQSESIYQSNNQVKTITFLETGTSNEAKYNLDGNTLTHQEFAFENAITQSSVTIDVTEIYDGTKYSDTCLAELDMYIEGFGWLFGLE